MSWLITKYLVTAGLVVAISEFAKRSDKLGGLIAALPFVTILTLIWLHIEQQPQEKIASHAWYTFWYVVPTLPMFLLFPALLPRVGFWPTLAACVVLTMICFCKNWLQQHITHNTRPITLKASSNRNPILQGGAEGWLAWCKSGCFLPI